MTMLLLLAASALAEGPVTKVVHIELTETHPYCGGAAPGPEQLERAQRPNPVSGRTYLVRKGSENTGSKPLSEVTTDRAGKLELHLEPGPYCLVTPVKREPADPAKLPAYNPERDGDTDPVCVAQLTRACDVAFTVPDEGEMPPLVLNFGNPCFWSSPPCYRGPPLPPPP